MAEEEDAPISVLILGGLGYIGRRLVKYIVNNNLAQYIRVFDKTLPEMAYLNADYKKVFADKRIEICQGNLAMPETVDKAYAPSERCPYPFQLVVCLASMTEYGRPEQMYKNYITDVRVLCAKKAALCQVEKYVEVSTGQVYAPTAKGAKESDAKAPWTVVAKCHADAEAEIARIQGLNYCILRLPLVYGDADRLGLMPRIVCARLYEYTGEKMPFLGGEDLRIHTVHVQDAAACIWHLLCAGAVGESYNLADSSDTTQRKLCQILERIFRIKTEFINSVLSSIAQMKLEDLVEEANDGHLAPWAELCGKQKINFTPLSPYIEKEQLYNNHLALDSSKLRATGFQCSCPQIELQLVLDSIRYWAEMGLFPIDR